MTAGEQGQSAAAGTAGRQSKDPLFHRLTKLGTNQRADPRSEREERRSTLGQGLVYDMNTDDVKFGGNGGGTKTKATSKPIPMHGQDHSITINIAGNSAVYFKYKPKAVVVKKQKTAEIKVSEKKVVSQKSETEVVVSKASTTKASKSAAKKAQEKKVEPKKATKKKTEPKKAEKSPIAKKAETKKPTKKSAAK